MKLVTFEFENKKMTGVEADSGKIISIPNAANICPDDLRGRIQPEASGTMLEILEGGESTLAAIRELKEFIDSQSEESLKSENILYVYENVRLLAPIGKPSKIVAIGLNYMDHCVEQKISPPESPLIFAKFPSAIIGHEEPITWDPDLTDQVDYEAELAVVIGKTARKVDAENAKNYIAGYTALNDVSARDLQFGDQQWIRGKSLDTFCPLGPCIVTQDEIGDPQNLKIQAEVNGEVLQDSNTSEMVFPVYTLVEYVSRHLTLEPGDIITTGTPNGVGVFRDPQIFLHDGDVVSISIEKIGTLTNRVSLS